MDSVVAVYPDGVSEFWDSSFIPTPGQAVFVGDAAYLVDRIEWRAVTALREARAWRLVPHVYLCLEGG